MSKFSITRRSFVAASAVTAAAVGMSLSGCGSSSTSSSTEKKTGGTITAGMSHATTNFSPVGASSALSLPAAVHVLEGLWNIDYTDFSCYKALSSTDTPTKISDTQYEVTLRDGAMFSNGNAVTAADVAASFTANMGEKSTYKDFLSFIDSVTAKDDKTVTINLKRPMGSLLVNRLALVLVFPKEMVDTDELKAMPIGSGPWMFDTIDGNDGGKVTFKKNPNYNGPKAPNAETMEWSVMLDATSRTTAMTEGSIMAMEDVPAANVDMVKTSGATVDTLSSYGLSFLMFNCIKAPFDNPKVRQAFFYAIDTEKLIKNQLDGNGAALKSFLPEDNKNFHQASTVFTYDVDKAKSLLTEAGYPNGLDITLRVNDSGLSKELATQIQTDLTAAGIRTNLDSVANTSFFTDLSNPHSVDEPLPYDVGLTNGDASCFGTDPDVLMSWWYDNDAWLKNRSCWGEASDGKCAELRELLASAREASSDSEAQTIWNKCFDLLSEQVPLYPVLYKKGSTAYNEKKIAGFKPVSTTGLYFMDASVK